VSNAKVSVLNVGTIEARGWSEGPTGEVPSPLGSVTERSEPG